jgi:tetratricopeptide (TPR) repeat protein
MRRLVFLACLLGCADYRQNPIFPEGAAHRPVVNEQALLGLSAQGNALVAQLVDADGEPPELWLAIFDARGGPTRKVLEAPEAMARTVSAQLQEQGENPQPLLEGIVRSKWPEAAGKARELGFVAEAQLRPVAAGGRSPSAAAPSNGPVDFIVDFDGPVLRITGEPNRFALILSGADTAYQVEVARMALAGEPVRPQLYGHDGVAWMLSGSYRKGAPLHRTVGLRRADLSRGQAQLENLRGLDALAAGDLDEAREAFDDGIAADPGYVDVLYNAASAAALMNDDAAAVALLARAAAADPARVQVLGRSDPNLSQLRKRDDVRALLGQRRPPPANVPAPP